jgi:hypothetical protein
MILELFAGKGQTGLAMSYRVFTQTPEGGIDPALLVRTATRHFEASVEILSADAPSAPGAGSPRVGLRLVSARRGFSQEFTIHTRTATAEDWAAARRAEAAGRSAGMSTLAERCRFIWVITPDSESPAMALLNLCAVLASAALGPVLPPDESALFGVRGAMERVETLGGRSLFR